MMNTLMRARRGDSRDKEDKILLGRVLGRKKDSVELHKIWIRKEQKGKGCGKRFFARARQAI